MSIPRPLEPPSFVRGNVTPEWRAVVMQYLESFPWIDEGELRRKLEPMLGWDAGAVACIMSAWALGLWVERRSSVDGVEQLERIRRAAAELGEVPHDLICGGKLPAVRGARMSQPPPVAVTFPNAPPAAPLFWKWNRDGACSPATREEFSAMMEGPPEHRLVGNARGPSSRVGAWVEVSTCFLGLDHSHGLASGPILFESIVFEIDRATGERTDAALEQQRYSTPGAAVLGHRRLVEQYLPVGEVYGWGPTVRSSGLIALEDDQLEGPQPDGEAELGRRDG